MQSIINNFARYITKNLNQSEEQYEINVYVINTWLHTLISVILTFTLSYMLGILKYAVIIGITAFILRSYSGGGHSKSPITCTMLSIIYINITALIVKSINISSLSATSLTTILILIGFYSINKYAPADTPQKPIISQKFRQKLKKKSHLFLLTLLIVIIVSYYLYNGYNWLAISVFFGLLWQLFSITPFGYRFLYNLDDYIDKMKGR